MKFSFGSYHCCKVVTVKWICIFLLESDAIKFKTKTSMIAYACDLITLKHWDKKTEWEDSLGYTASSRSAWSIVSHCLKKKLRYKNHAVAYLNSSFLVCNWSKQIFAWLYNSSNIQLHSSPYNQEMHSCCTKRKGC